MSTVYALFVGINDYISESVTNLNGCVDDVTAIQAVLSEQVGSGFNARTLTDRDATRAAIIEAFTSHLSQAREGDTALFYYCGHGSLEPCPPEWATLEANGALQTIVPVDARVNGVHDIADKELAALLHALAASNAHIVTIFDSCHSGGVTRSLDNDPLEKAVTRMTGELATPRPLSAFLPEAITLHAPERITQHGAPRPTHIAITACQEFELAKEWPRAAPKRGAFSEALEETLRTTGSAISYVDLVNSVRTKVRSRVTEQQPMLTTVGDADAGALFLGGRGGRRDLSITIDETTKAIWLAAGAATGIADPKQGAGTTVAIHPRGALTDATATPVPLATATVVEVQVDRARLQLDDETVTLDPQQVYAGVITRLSTPQLTVTVTGSPDSQVQAVRKALVTRSGLYAVTDAPLPGIPSISAQVGTDRTTLHDADGHPYPGLDFRHDTKDVAALIEAVVHIAKWFGIRDRTPVTSTLNGVVDIEIVPCQSSEETIPADRPAIPVTDGAVSISYTEPEGYFNFVRLRHRSPKNLWLSAVALGEELDAFLLHNGWVNAGSVATAFDGKMLCFAIPELFGSATECLTTIKVFAATSPIDGTALALPALLGAGTRGLGDASKRRPPDTSTWGTTSLQVTLRR